MRESERTRMIDHAGRKVATFLPFDDWNLSILTTIFNNRIFILREVKTSFSGTLGDQNVKK